MAQLGDASFGGKTLVRLVNGARRVVLMMGSIQVIMTGGEAAV
jgi:hypothetical protein